MSQTKIDSPPPDSLSQVVDIEKKPLHFKVVRGAISSVVRKIAVAPISLLLVPFTLHKVGVAGYGTWAILATIINLTWLMDPGLSPAVTKYVAEHAGTDDVPEIRSVLDASFALCLAMSAIASCILWLFSRAIIGEFFRGPSAPQASEILSFWPLVTLCVVTFLLTTPLMAFINGRQRMDLTNVLIFSAEILSACATVVFLLAGAKVRGLLWVQLITTSYMLAGSLVIIYRLSPSAIPNPFRCKFAMLRKLVAFSVPLYAGYVMTTLQGQLEKLYLARFLGVVPVGWYNVASVGAAKFKRVPDLLLGPVLAAASELDAAKEQRKVEELHFRAHKYVALTAVPLAVFAVATAKSLISLWVGNGLTIIAVPFALLVIGNLFPQAGAPTYFIMVGRGILRPTVYAAVIAAVLNVGMSYVFIKHWGFSGAVLGTALPMIISTIYFFAAYKPYFEVPLYQTLRRAYLKPLLCSLLAVPGVLLIEFLNLRTSERLCIDLVAFGVVYLIGLVATRFFDSFDVVNAEKHVPYMRLARRFVPVS